MLCVMGKGLQARSPSVDFSLEYVYRCMFSCGFVYMDAVSVEGRRGHEFPGAAVPGCWELNSGPLEKQKVLLIPMLFLQLLWSLFLR